MTWQIVENASGERQVINSEVTPLEAVGEGWSVIAEDVGEPPDAATWDGTQWVIDSALVQERDETAEVTDKQRLRQALRRLNNRQQQIIDAVQELQARVDALEGN